MPLEPTKSGLLVRLGEYEPLRAFSQGGRYWDRVPQQLIRENSLAEFLPPVEVEEDDRGKFGRFHFEQSPGRRDLLSRSKPLGRRGVPTQQLARLQQAIAEFKQKANDQAAQPQNRQLIERFQLPDIGRDPELYRLAGPWWDRRLQILWGCERAKDSSLPASAAAANLPQDRHYRWRRLLTALLLLLLLLLPVWWLCANWSRLWTHRPPGASTQAELERKAKQAAQAETAAAQADAKAKQAQAAADQAKADALAARQAANKANPAKAPGQPSSTNSPTASTNQSPAQPPVQAKAALQYQIVLCEQGQPAADGTMGVSLEVRPSTKPPQAVPVQAWQFENQTVTGQTRLETRMKGGDHLVKAVILDADGKQAEVSAVVSVQPGKVITTGGKVSVRAK